MLELVAEVRHAARSLIKSPTLLVVASLTLALGIGANAAIFSLLDATLLAPLPYPRPDRLVKIWGRFTDIGTPGDRNWISVPEFEDIRAGQHSFSAVAAIDTSSFNVSAGIRPERVAGAAVSPAFFKLIGVAPALGRTFFDDEAQPGRDNVVVLSDAYWRRSFGSDSHVVGRVVRVNGVPAEIVGVMPAGFAYPPDAEMWTPRAFSAEELAPTSRGSHSLEVLARIEPSLTMDRVRADMARLSESIIEANPQYHYREVHFALLTVPLAEEMVGDIRAALFLLMGTVGFVLLIACANVANLQFVRASGRARELAVRAALGAGRGRLVRQLLIESLLLACCGGALGLLAARWALAVLVPLAAHAFPRVAGTTLDGSVLAFTALVVCLTAVVFGIAPAIRGAGVNLTDTLRSAGRSSSGDPASRRLRRLLVAGEIALALVLLVGAGLFARSLARVLDVDSGFRPGGVLTFRVALPGAKYDTPGARRAFFRDLLDRARRMPGVVSAGAVTFLPLGGSGSSGTTTVDSPIVTGRRASFEADWRAVLPGYFETMGIHLISGRWFTEADNESGALVAIVDETMARAYWPGRDAVGQRIRRGGPASRNPWLTIVGVVAHVRYRTLEAASRAELYWPELQTPWPFETFTLRTAVDPASLRPVIEREVAAIDPEQPIFAVRTMSEIVADSTARRRLATELLGVFAGVALLLAMAGVYGISAHAVAERTSELGLRLALGADPSRVVALIVGQSLVLATAGVAVGLAAAKALARAVAGQLFQVTPGDPAILAGASALLVATGLLASYLPARRAARIDPAATLRAE